jgi:type IV pilus assembly protein PilO
MPLNFNLKELHLKDLNLLDVGEWAPAVRILASSLFFILILFLGYFFVIQGEFLGLKMKIQQEADLRQQYQFSHDKLLKFSRYEKEIVEMEKKYTPLLSQVPKNPNVTEFLAAVSKLGVDSGLKFEIFDPLPEQPKDFYTILPFRIVVTGDYHQIANFMVRLAKLDRLVTFEIFSVRLVELENQETSPNMKQDLQVDLLLYSYVRAKASYQNGELSAKN